ncbi:hypothetical protein [Microbacterium saperdae]|uniref:Phage shock protein B n=1 Tax=Microbacterium saperdae TaxID=69368 RepID=A0A543BQV4_9MICO|nr:hypothetical protein [Microbacterium saperdae]TQL87201.1 hypothetical protein FB560_2868 [Microbacterium saperdae]GGM42135.1 hypothetical protein GCM10010489_11490 [Microbacterium saperdae]
MEIVATLGGWGVALVIAVIALLPKKGSLEHQMIDQQQERIEKLEGRLDALEPALAWYQRRDVAWERREAQLMSGAERGEYPPWPARVGILAEEKKHD